MLVVKQVLGICKNILHVPVREQRADISSAHWEMSCVFASNRSRLSVGLVLMMEWEKNKKNIKMYLRGSMPVMPLRPSQKPLLSLYLQGIEFHIFQLSPLLKTQGDWQGHIWDVNKLQHKHQLSLSGMAFLTACRNHIDMPVCAQITVLFNIPRETSERHCNVNITLIYRTKKKLLKVTIKVLFVSFS